MITTMANIATMIIAIVALWQNIRLKIRLAEYEKFIKRELTNVYKELKK